MSEFRNVTAGRIYFCGAIAAPQKSVMLMWLSKLSVDHPGADAAKAVRKGALMAVTADRLCSRILAAGMAVFFVMALPNRLPAQAAPLIRIADDMSLCLDSMETEPFDDDQDAVPAAAALDGGCLLPDRTISI